MKYRIYFVNNSIDLFSKVNKYYYYKEGYRFKSIVNAFLIHKKMKFFSSDLINQYPVKLIYKYKTNGNTIELTATTKINNILCMVISTLIFFVFTPIVTKFNFPLYEYIIYLLI